MFEHARRNLRRWAEGIAFGPGEQATLEEWRRILDEADVSRLIEMVTDTSDDGQRLRSSSPWSAPSHLWSDWKYLRPVNRGQLLDLTERVKLMAGIELPVILGLQARYGFTSQALNTVKRSVECDKPLLRAFFLSTILTFLLALS